MNRFASWLIVCVGLAAAAALAFNPGGRGRLNAGLQAGNPPQEPSTAEQQRQAIAVARDFAAAVAQPDTPEYYRVLEQSLQTLRVREFGPGATPPGRILEAPEGATPEYAAMRQRIRQELSELTSLHRDPVWQENFDKWLNQRVVPDEQPLRIIGGVPTEPGEFPDCVAVGSPGGFCCSGTLISKDLVVTAAHCVRGGCADRIFIGNNSNQPQEGRVIAVRKAVVHPDYNPFIANNDIALLVLDDPVENVTPRKIADSAAIDSAPFVRLVGFGITEFGPFGVQFKVDAIVASSACATTEAQNRYGCNAQNEIVAGGNGVDSCNGDSGGPAYVEVDGELRLAGATSRATKNFTQPCGDGGIYARVDRYVDWIREVAEQEMATYE